MKGVIRLLMVSRQREGVSGREEAGRIYKNLNSPWRLGGSRANSLIWSTLEALFSGTVLRDSGALKILADKM